MKKETQQLIDKAKRSIKAARRLYDHGDYDFAVSRTYYALFYVSEALLLSRGKSYSKHAAVISAIYDEFIKPDDLPKAFHKLLHWAFNLRQQGDYLCEVPISKEIAMDLIDQATKQIQLVMNTFFKVED